jgi:hypothetical protein
MLGQTMAQYRRTRKGWRVFGAMIRSSPIRLTILAVKLGGLDKDLLRFRLRRNVGEVNTISIKALPGQHLVRPGQSVPIMLLRDASGK